MNDRNKGLAPYKYQHYVFQEREERIHWDISICVEYQSRWSHVHRNPLRAETLSETREDEDISAAQDCIFVTDDDIPTVQNKYSYELNSFLAVQAQ